MIVKSGVDPSNAVDVCKHIVEQCTNLKLQGLMTIGMFGRDPSVENPDFKVRIKKTTILYTYILMRLYMYQVSCGM